MNELTTTQQNTTLTPAAAPGLDTLIAAWLDAKHGRSGSAKTLKAYADTLNDFRAVLRGAGLDLDAPAAPVALIAQAWGGARKGRGGAVTATTFNQRLAIVSSFYAYARRAGLSIDNPIDRVERRRVQDYAGAAGLDVPTLKRALKAIDRSTAAGARDYALITLALNTGRRAAEIVGLQLRDLLHQGGDILVTFRHCKGGKVMHDRLSGPVAAALTDYLLKLHGGKLTTLAPETPVFPALSRARRGAGNQAMTTQAFADVCQKRVGTGKVHALRHTFARLMEDKGAKVSEIQAKLGHDNLNTTGRYLAALKRSDNPYAELLAAELME